VRLAVDIGGTFTDVVLSHAERDTTVKVLTTYDDPANGVMQGVHEVLGRSGVAAGAVSLCLHGTTLATNALIERRGATTALLTTEGHRDALEMAFENRFEQYDVNIDRPAPLVPRALRLPVRERLSASGRVLLALDEDSVADAVRVMCDANVSSVAVGLIHAWRDDAHERRVAELVSEMMPGVCVSLSSAVCPEIREYERLSTTCANAYVLPLMEGYLESLAGQLAAAGVRSPVLMMTSGGGLTDLATAARFPIRLVESGPAGGAILAAHLARCGAHDALLSFDMGGTTAKICLIDDGEPLLSRAFEVDRTYRFKKGSGLPVRIPVIEMVEIGAGGGSIASVDKLGRLQVGPESAGSEPGPAAYGRGGERATVSDADVVLGKLLPERFAGGSLRLDMGAARRAVRNSVADALSLSEHDAARGVHEIVVENMAAAARAHAVEWGKSNEGRTMVAYGGAGPLHACALANRLKIDQVIVPAGAGVGSAIGFLAAPVSFEVVRSRYMRLGDLYNDAVSEVFAELRGEATAVVEAATQAPLIEVRKAYMRYIGQGFEVAVPVEDPSHPGLRHRLRDAFEREYETLYGRVIPDLEVEVLSWTLALQSAGAPVEPLKVPEAVHRAQPETMLEAGLGTDGAMVSCAVYAREALRPGDYLPGPALVVEDQTTTALPRGFRLSVADNGDLYLNREANEGEGGDV